MSRSFEMRSNDVTPAMMREGARLMTEWRESKDSLTDAEWARRVFISMRALQRDPLGIGESQLTGKEF